MLEMLRAGRRPRRSYVSTSRARVSKCPCTKGSDRSTLRSVFEALEMPHAALMHGSDAVDWTAEDWKLHIEEEDRSLFPALRKAGADPSLVSELETDHAVYGPILDAGANLPRGDAPHSIDVHGALEDVLIFSFAPQLLARADGGASVGFDLHSANASREGALEELCLLEKHISQERCPQCLHKHLFTAIAYLKEARTLRGGDDLDTLMASALRALEPSIDDALEPVQSVRKELQAGLGFSGAHAAVGATAASSSFNYAALEKSMTDAAAADAAARQKRVVETNAKLDDWGKAYDKYTGTPFGSWLAGTTKLALAATGVIVRWVQGDWDSDKQKQRALSAVKNSIDAAMPPRDFDADIDFAKTYADGLEADMSRASSLQEPWKSVFDDYVATVQANASSPLVVSAFVRAAGSFSGEFGAPLLCGALFAVDPKAPNYAGVPASNYPLANLLAAAATARFGTPLEANLKAAYGALSTVAAVHPTICTGRGFKGAPNTWDYDHGPVLFVLQAWLALSPTPHVDFLMAHDPSKLVDLAQVAAKDPYAKRFSAPASSGPLVKAALVVGGLGALFFFLRSL